jgi:hypothetical protein
MKLQNRFLALLAAVLSFGALVALPLPALAGETASAQAVQKLVDQWRIVRPGLKASAANPAQAKLMAEYETALNNTGRTLESIVSLSRSSDPSAKAKLPSLFNELKLNLGKMQMLRTQLKADTEFTRKSGQLFGIVSNVLKEQHNITSSAVRNLRN